MKQPGPILSWLSIMIGVAAFILSIYSTYILIRDEKALNYQKIIKSEQICASIMDNREYWRIIRRASKIKRHIETGKDFSQLVPKDFLDCKWFWVYEDASKISEMYRILVNCIESNGCNEEYFGDEGTCSLCLVTESDFNTMRWLASFFVSPEIDKQPTMLEYSGKAYSWMVFERICGRNPTDLSLYNDEYDKLYEKYWKSDHSSSQKYFPKLYGVFGGDAGSVIKRK